ncbi:hypothetical protein JOD57_003868 [Geodermatophilus bullaregiensis]|nr:hypothetical protein [Geodermatophilus bullaregiensis]
MLGAADEQANAAIARRLGICVDTVRNRRARFCAEGLSGLADRPRPGRGRSFAPTVEAEVKALACALPAEAGFPLARRSAAELAAEAVGRGLVETISASTLPERSDQFALRSHHVASQLDSTDEYDAVMAGYRQRGHRIALEASFRGTRFLYTNTYDLLGHFQEYLLIDDATKEWLATLPRN